MSIEVVAGDLAAALNLLGACVEKKTTIPILSSVLVSADNGRLTLRATDLEVGLTLQIGCTSLMEQTACIEAARLAPVVKSFARDAAVSLRFAETHWATLKCGKTTAKIPGFDPKSFPELPELPAEPVVTIGCAALVRMIHQTTFCVTKEESRFALNGALLQVGGGKAIMVATDGHRMALSRSEASGDLRKILSLSLLRVAERVFDGVEGEVSIYSDANHTILIGPSGQVLVGRDLTGNFPQWERVIPADLPGKFQISSTDLLTALGRCLLFSDDHSKAMRFELIEEGLQVSAAQSDTGEATDVVSCQHDGSYRVCFNGGYIAEVARQAAALEWHYKDGNCAARLVTLDGSAEWIVMPQRI